MKMHETAWPRMPLGDVSVINPRRPVLKRPSDAPTAFVPMSAVDESNGTIREYALRRYEEISKGYTYFEEGDILFAKITPCMQNGKHAIIHDIPGGFGFGSTEFHVIRSSDRVDANYLLHFLRQPSVLSGAAAHFQGAVGQQRVPPEYIRSLAVPLPPVTEQKRIAAKLDEQMATLASAQAALAAQREAATALRSVVLRTALDPATHSDWSNSELRHLVTFANGLWTGKRPPFRQVKVIRNTNFSKECALDLRDVALIDVEGKQLLSRQLQPGDIILERSGGGPTQPVGRVALFELHEGVYSFSNFTSVMRVLPSGSIMPRFLWYYLYYLYRSGATENLQNRTSGIRNLAFDSYAELQVPVPTLAQQQRIAKHLDNGMKQIDTLLASIDVQAATLGSLRTSLLDAAFSGQV